MAKEMNRRQFIKTMAGGAVGAAGLGMLGGLPLAAAEQAPAAPGFEGKMKFAGVHNVRRVTEDLVYLGASDCRLELFENTYPIPRGVSYNAYLLLDEKTVLFDTVDRSVCGQFFENLLFALGGRPLDYLVVNHMEPDHCAAISEVMARWPKVTLVCSRAAEPMIRQFFGFEVSDHGYMVDEGDSMSTGRHTLQFVMVPMVHWPEAMMTFDTLDGVLFSADAFGSFGALNGNLFADEVDFEAAWLPDARRYYTNIVGKYGPQVQDVLKKAGGLDIKLVCPLHGPVWRKDLGWFIEKYDRWSRYEPEDEAAVVIYGSIYGGTESAARLVASRLSEGGLRNVQVYDASKTPVSELIAEAFRVSHLVIASITYNMGIFTPVRDFLNDLADHNLQNRRFALIENGSWSPASGRLMGEKLSALPGMQQVGETLTILSTPSQADHERLTALADAVLDSLGKQAPAAEAAAAAEDKAPVAWRCTVCGYVVEMDELPDDYTCPVCGVGKDKFEKVE